MNRYSYLFSRNVVRAFTHSQFFNSKYFLSVGQTYSETKVLTPSVVEAFAQISGDFNPIHLDTDFINSNTKFEKPIVHGALLNSLVSGILGNKLPGPGTILVKQELNFPSPCYVGDEVKIDVTVKEVRKFIIIDFCCSSGDKIVLHGYAKVLRKFS